MFSQWAEPRFGLFTYHAVKKTRAEQIVGIEECGADVNWKEMCNQIPLKFSSFDTKGITLSEHLAKQDTATDLHSAKHPEHAELFYICLHIFNTFGQSPIIV